MPIYLPPLGRREFLIRSIAGVAGALAVHTLRAADSVSSDPDSWILFSDTHVAEDLATIRREVNMAEHMRNCVSQAVALKRPAAGLIVNGDCSLDVGLAGDYQAFHALLQPVREAGVPIHLTLGNHDDRQVMETSLSEAAVTQRPVSAKHVTVIETPKANWFLLDSLDVTKQTPGRLGEEQRAWLGKALDERPGKPAILMVHHNPILDNAAKPMGLLDGLELRELAAPRKQVKAVLFGHTHRWFTLEVEGVHYINLPAVAYPFSKTEATGWMHCKLSEAGMSLQMYATDATHERNGKVTEFEWRKG